jgi:hypothetical protein
MIKTLRSTGMIIFVVALCLLPQIISSASIFVSLSKFDKDSILRILSGLASIPLELAILLYVIRGKKNLSYFFCGISITMNVLYYWESPDNMKSFLSMLVIAVSLPIAIAFFSEEINQDKAKESEQKAIDYLHAEFQKFCAKTNESINGELLRVNSEMKDQIRTIKDSLFEHLAGSIGQNQIEISNMAQHLAIATNMLEEATDELKNGLIEGFEDMEKGMNNFCDHVTKQMERQLPIIIQAHEEKIRKELDKEVFNCDICNKPFDSQASVNKHKAHTHNKQTEQKELQL